MVQGLGRLAQKEALILRALKGLVARLADGKLKVMLQMPLLTLSLIAHAEMSAFEKSLQNETRVKTEESVEQFGGVTYRKVVADDGTFYFKLLGRDGDVSELVCNTNFKAKSPHLVTVGVQVFTRTRLFVRTLKEDCLNQHGQQRFSVDSSRANIELGVQLPDDDGPVKDRSIYTAPLAPQPNLGFGGSF